MTATLGSGQFINCPYCGHLAASQMPKCLNCQHPLEEDP